MSQKRRWFAGRLVQLYRGSWQFEDVTECVDGDHAQAIAALQGDEWHAVCAEFKGGFITLKLSEFHWPPTDDHRATWKDAAIVRALHVYMHEHG